MRDRLTAGRLTLNQVIMVRIHVPQIGKDNVISLFFFMFSALIRSKWICDFFLRFFVWLDNIAYRGITKVALLESDGTHPKHRIMNYHQFFLDHVAQTDNVIDVGCGKGLVTYDIAKKVNCVVGIDCNSDNVEYAKKNFLRGNAQYLVGDATAYVADKKFDVIILSNVLEHISDRITFLKKMHSLAPIILLRVPMIDRDWVTIYKKEHNLEYRLDKTHYIEYTIPMIKKELIQADWDLKEYSVQFGELWGVVKKV